MHCSLHGSSKPTYSSQCLCTAVFTALLSRLTLHSACALQSSRLFFADLFTALHITRHLQAGLLDRSSVSHAWDSSERQAPEWRFHTPFIGFWQWRTRPSLCNWINTARRICKWTTHTDQRLSLSYAQHWFNTQILLHVHHTTQVCSTQCMHACAHTFLPFINKLGQSELWSLRSVRNQQLFRRISHQCKVFKCLLKFLQSSAVCPTCLWSTSESYLCHEK